MWEQEEKERRYFEKVGNKDIHDTKSIIVATLQKQLGDKWFYAFLNSICDEKEEKMPIELLEAFWQCCRHEAAYFQFDKNVKLPRANHD